MHCSWQIPFATVVTYKLPGTGFTILGTAQPSWRTGPAPCTTACARQPAWPHRAAGDAKRMAGGNGAIEAASVLVLRLGEGGTWDVS